MCLCICARTNEDMLKNSFSLINSCSLSNTIFLSFSLAIKMRVSCRISLWAIVLLLYIETVVSQLTDKSNMEQFDKWSFLPNNTPDKSKQHSNEARYLRATRKYIFFLLVSFSVFPECNFVQSMIRHQIIVELSKLAPRLQ